MSSELRTINKNPAIADLAVVTDMHVRHDQIAVADARDPTAFDRSAMHGAEFAKLIVVSRFEPHPLSGICEVLRISAHNRKRIKMIVAAKHGRTFYHSMRIEHATV